MTTPRVRQKLSYILSVASVLVLPVLLWGAAQTESDQVAALRQSLNDSFGAKLPFDQLPTVKATGKMVSIEGARAMAKTQRNLAEKKHMRAYFPPDTKTDPKMWRDVQGVDGKTYRVPNETHENYAKFITAIEKDYTDIDQFYQKNYGDKYKAFSEGAYKEINTWRKAGWETDVELVGKFQNTIHSDIDATFKNAKDRDQLVSLLKKKGLTVETDPEGHGLYVKVKELDYVLWGKETVGDIQAEYDAADPADKPRLKQRLDAAMRDVEVCATTAGARNMIFGDGAIDDQGAKLDYIKKFAQADDMYTKNKIVGKMSKFDIGSDAYKKSLESPGKITARKLDSHATNAQALRTEGMPAAVKAVYEKQFVTRAMDDVVDSYRLSAVKSMVENEVREKTRNAYLQTAASLDASDPLAQNLRNMAAKIDEDLLSIRKSNARTLKSIEQANPDLGRRLRRAENDAVRILNKDPEGTKRAVRDVQALRKICRQEVDVAMPKKAWLPVAKEAATSFISKTDMVFNVAGDLGGMAKLIDEGMALEAQGKGSAADYVAKGMAKDMAMKQLIKANPKLGSVMQIMDVPQMMVAEMELQLDKAAAGSGNYTGAKLTAIVNVIKRKTFIGTLEKVLNEEGMAEVEGEMQTGHYSWTDVALRTATRTIGEVTQINDIIRMNVNSEYNVHGLEAEANQGVERMRQKALAKGTAQDKNLERLRDQILKLQLSPNASDPTIEAQIQRLQAEYDQGLTGIQNLTQIMRRKFTNADPLVNSLNQKVNHARIAQKIELLEAQMIHITGTQEPMTQSTLNRLKRIKAEYSEAVDKYQKISDLYSSPGGGDPVAEKMTARLQAMKNLRGKMADWQYDYKAQWAREDEQKREERVKYEQELGQEIQQHAARGGLPDGVTVDDQALLIELDDLKQQQAKGDIPQDADLLTMAGNNVWRDTQYQTLRRLQQDGQIPADADLTELLGQVSDLHQMQLRGELSGDVDLTDSVVSGEGTEILDKAVLVKGQAQTIKIPPFPGADGNVRVQTVEYIKTFAPYIGQPKREERGGETILEEKIEGKGNNGARKRFKNGKLIREDGYLMGQSHGPSRWFDANGRLTSESFSKNGKKHGPFKSYYPDGRPSSEVWFKEDLRHGWERRWNKQGILTGEEIYVEGEVVCSRDFNPTGHIQSETLYDRSQQGTGKNGKPCWPRLHRGYYDTGLVSSVSRSDENGDPVGLQVSGSKNGSRTERFFNDDNENLWMHRYEAGDYRVEEINYTQVDGKSALHGICTKWYRGDSPKKGEIQYQCSFDEGVADGAYVEHLYDGKTLEGDIEGGLLHGRWEYRDKEETLVAVRNFREGLSDGIQKTYYPDGTLQAETRVENHAPVSYKSYFDNGEPEYLCQGTFPSGNAVKPSPVKATQAGKGSLCSVSFDTRGFAHPRLVTPVTGSVKWWRLNQETNKATMSREFEVRDGKFHGPRTAYYPDGKVQAVENCKDGLLHGVCMSYFEDGKVRCRANMTAGRSEGSYQHRQYPGCPLVDLMTKQGYRVGWQTGYNSLAKITSMVHTTVPVKGQSRVFECKGPTVHNPWSPFTTYAAWGVEHGPRININSDGSLGYTQYRINPKEGYSMTHDVDTYLKWCTEHPDLPTEIPGYGKIEPKKKVQSKPKPAPAPQPQPKPMPDFSKAKIILEKDVSVPPKGLSRDKVHEIMMKLWGDINDATRDKQYRVAEYKAVYAAKLARAYKQWEIRALYISYEKAAMSAKRAGNLPRALKYLDISKQAASEVGDSEKVKQIEAMMKDYAQ